MSSATLELAQRLIRLRSVTPEDAGCQDLIARRLEPLGFALESTRCGEVANLRARRGQAKPQVLELRPVDASIHKLNEQIESDDLDALKSIYRQVLERLLLPA